MADRRLAKFFSLIAIAGVFLQPGIAGASDLAPVWQVSGVNNQVYLVGSIHLLRREDYPLPAAIDRAYAESEAILMEIDLDDLDPFAAQSAMRELGVLPPGKTLKDLMGAEHYPTVEQAAATMDIPLDLLQQSRPWLAAVTIEQLLLNRIGFDPALGIEAQLMARAVTDGKQITGLETLREQLNFLASLTLETQRQLLLQTLAANENLEAQMDGMIAAWRRGDSAYLEAQMLDDIASYPELYAVIVSNRNQRWAEQLEQLLDDDQDYLVVVGSMHLVGEDGVPAILEERQYRVAQMPAQSAEH